MTHLKIEQNNSAIEQVSSAVITKLYELATSGELDQSSNLVGRLHAQIAPIKCVQYLNDEFDNLYISADQYSIFFEDSAAEQVCVSNWGSNGTVTANQLAAVTNATTQFSNNTSIVTFNEFQYFTSIVDFKFNGCTNLREITLPLNVTAINTGYAFSGCTSLQEFDLSNIFVVGQYVFNGCSNCTFLNIEHINSTGQYAFRECAGITSIELKDGINLGPGTFYNSGVTSVTFKGDASFDGTGGVFDECSRLQSVTFEGQMSCIPFRMFRKCSNLRAIDLSNVHSYRKSNNDSYYGGHFSECSNLASVTLSTYANRLEVGMFAYCGSLTSITIPDNVTEIGSNCFFACRNLTVTCLPTTPPTLDPDGNEYKNFWGVPSIRVPAASLSAYQSATGWSTFTDKLVAIPTT